MQPRMTKYHFASANAQEWDGAQAAPPKKPMSVTHMIRFLSRVDSKVAFEGLQVPEACAADLAGVWLLPSVNKHVSTKVSHLEKAAPGEDRSRYEGILPGARASSWEWGSAQMSFFGLLGSS